MYLELQNPEINDPGFNMWKKEFKANMQLHNLAILFPFWQ